MVEMDEEASLQVHTISCGAEHVLILSTDGRLFSWGRNRYGECGLGHQKPVTVPTVSEKVTVEGRRERGGLR